MTNAIPAQSHAAAPVAPKVSPSTSGKGEFLLKPRRQIGPDSITMLRHVSRRIHDDKHVFNDYRVQRNEFGKPNPEFDFNNIEFVGRGHADSYGVLINEVAVPLGKKMAQRLEGAPNSLIVHTLDVLLKRSLNEDSTAWWALSTVELRRLLFPHAYNADHRRVDMLLYFDRPKDKPNRGKACFLSGLKTGRNQRFIDYATSMIPQPIDPKFITPIQLERTTS